MSVSIDEISKVYELFNNDDIDGLVGLFAPGAVYYQADSWQTATGPDQIRGVMEGWKSSFTGAKIQDVKVQERPELVDEIPGAVQCFFVTFTGVGVYDKTLPGLDDTAPAHHREVHLPITETVWVNDSGKFVRVTNTAELSALQLKQ